MLDFDPFSLVEPAYLVTIIGESILKDSLIQLLKDLKVRSYTVSEIQGEGRYMRRSADPEAPSHFIETSLEIRAIVSQELSQVILHVLKEQQPDFALFAYRQQVEALIDDINQ